MVLIVSVRDENGAQLCAYPLLPSKQLPGGMVGGQEIEHAGLRYVVLTYIQPDYDTNRPRITALPGKMACRRCGGEITFPAWHTPVECPQCGEWQTPGASIAGTVIDLPKE